MHDERRMMNYEWPTFAFSLPAFCILHSSLSPFSVSSVSELFEFCVTGDAEDSPFCGLLPQIGCPLCLRGVTRVSFRFHYCCNEYSTTFSPMRAASSRV